MVVDTLNPMIINIIVTYNAMKIVKWVFTSWYKFGMNISDSYSKHLLHGPNLSGDTYYMFQRCDGFHS